MSELEKLLPKEPEFQSFTDWRTSNESGDAIKDRQNYADYVRGEYIGAGAYSDKVENDIRSASIQGSVEAGLIDPQDNEQVNNLLFPSEEEDLDTQLNAIKSTFDPDSPDWKTAVEYLTFKEVNPDLSGLPESYVEREQQLRANAEEVASQRYNDAKRKMVLSGELPIAKIRTADGKEDVIIGSMFENMSLPEAIRASKKGGVRFSDAALISAKIQTPEGFKEPLYKVERYQQAAGLIEKALGDSAAKTIDRYSTAIATSDKEGVQLSDLQKPDIQAVRSQLNKLLPEGEGFTDAEVDKAMYQLAYHQANANGKFKYFDSPEDAAKNIRNVGYSAPFVHPATMANKTKFDEAIAAHPELSEKDKNLLNNQREIYLEASFDDYNKLLSRSDMSDDWMNTLQAGRASGKKNSKILEEFVADENNFNELKSRIYGIGASIVDGFGELVAAFPMMAGSEWARDYMVNNVKQRSDRREVTRLFGQEFGMVQDFAESLAPMLVDVGATALLYAVTSPAAGVGGAGYLSAKTGARLTAKGLVKAMTSNALRQLPTESLEQASERLVAQGLIKASTAEAGRDGAMAAIKAYNSSLAKTIGTSAAVALPAFNRSAGATYASVYTTLEGNKDLTPEQRHDRALGAAMTSGTITAAITMAFSAFGRGGLEHALLNGASYKQIKNVVTRLSGVDDIADDVFNKAVSKQLSESLKKYSGFKVGGKIFKNVVDEAPEEGLDTFVNGFVSDAATDKDTPFLERLEQAGRAAIIGGVIGGGVPAIKAVRDSVAQQNSVASKVAIEVDFAKGVSDKLTQSGSPIAAQTVYSILTAPRRTRAPYAQAILEGSRQPIEAVTPETTVGDTVAEVPDVEVPETEMTGEKLLETLNNTITPEAVAKSISDDRGQSYFSFIEDIPENEIAKRGKTLRKMEGASSPVAQQMEFDFVSKQEPKPQAQLDLALDTSDPAKPKVVKQRSAAVSQIQKKAGLAEQLGLDFDSASVDEQNNHVDPNYSDEDITEDERSRMERIRMSIELFGAIESGQLEAPAPKGEKAAKGVSAQATAAPAKPVAKLPKAGKAPVTSITPVADEPMFAPDEFIDDELIGQEVAAMTKIATLGYPIRLERKALHGMPQRGKYPKGYLAGKSDMVARKVNELYPVSMPKDVVAADTITGKDRVSFYDPQAKKVVRKAPKAFVDENGVGIFNNDPVSMKLLLDRRIPVVVPDSFTNTINPSFRMYTSGGTRFLNDIVMTNPETGTGFVSALTRQDKVISSEPNYQYYDKLSSFTSLFNEGVADRSVPDPKGGEAQVTIGSLINDADQLYTAASTGSPTSAYGDPDKANATLRSILKPRQGTLEPEFFEAAVPAFSMAVRQEAYLYELRLAVDKFAERKSGESSPSLKTKSIQQAIEEVVSRTKVDKVTAAQNLAKVFGSDINPEKQPDLVIQKFIEDTVLTRRPNMPTYREIGAKVGNVFAEQQRTRDIFNRKALFQTTDPTDLAQIQDNTDLFDPEAEVADNTFIVPTELFDAPDSGLISKALEEAAFDAADALDTDPEMRAVIDKMLRQTVFKGNSAIDVTKLSSTDAFGMLASWMSSGNYNTNPVALKFQRDLRDGVYENGERLRRPLKLMYLSSKTIEGDPSKDDAYVDSIRENLANSFGRPVSKQEASAFIKSIGGAVQKLWSRSYVRGEQIIFARQQNDADVARLGLKTNDPESVINAFKVIASTEADPNKRLLAKLLLENQGYIRQVEFSLDESPLEYSGGYIVGSNGQPMISINLDGHNGRGLADVLLHEYTHAFVSIAAASPNENLNAAQRGSLQRLNGILELARRSAADNGITDPVLVDGLENINEFVAHFFTSTDFQGYLKSLLPPTKQRGFFARTIDAVLDMFGLNRSKQSNYQKAFADMVDLTRAAVLRAPLTPKGLINRLANPASRTLQQVSEAAQAIRQTLATSVEQPTQYEVYDRQTGEVVWTGARRDIARQVQDNRDNAYGGYRFAVRQTAAATPTPETLATAIDQETEDLVSGIGAQDVAPSINEVPAEVVAKMKDIIRMVRRMVPAEFEFDAEAFDLPHAAAFHNGKIRLNPYRMAGVVDGLDRVSARGIVEGIMTEEAAHAASFNALTQQELDNYIATLKNSDFEAIIDTYYQSDEKKAAAKLRINSEDAAVAYEEAYILAEEKLRMHSQKVTRGFTTEEDYMFWRSKPSLLKIVGRYMKGFINRYMAGKSLATMNGTQRVALQRMITEVRAINAGYRLTPNTLEFDAQNPHASLSQIAAQLLGTQVVTEGVKLAQPLVQKTKEFNETFLSDFWPKILKQVGGLSGRTAKGIRQAAEFAFSEVEPWVRENPKFIDYYESDWNVTKEYLEEAFPSVKEKPELIKLFRLISGLCSPSTKLSDNMVDAVNALDLWIREDNFDSIKLEISPKGNMKLGKTPFTFRSTTGALKGRALKIVGELIKQQGSIDSVVEYLKEPVDYKTLQEFNKSVGYKGSVGGIGSIRNVVREATGQDTLIPRMFVFGQKVGAYTLNAVGDSRFTTTDIWEGRMIRSYFKNGFKTGTGLPENVDDQALMQLFATEFNSVWEQRTGVKMEPSALQAVRWFFIIDRLNSAGYIYAKTNETISGYTKSALKQRGFTSSVAGGRGTGVPTDAQETTATTAGQSTRVVYERNVGSDPDAGRRFVEGIRRTATEHPMGAAVEVKPEEFYNDPNNRLFLTEDGLAGVAVTSYGDLVSVFKHPTSKAKITEILDEAAQYAVTLDAFDVNGFLPNLYSRNGFRPAARVPFNKDYAPQGWPFDLAGEPDVVLMVKDTDGDSGLPAIGSEGYAAIRDSIPVTNDYDAAMAMQAAAKEKVAKAKAAKELTAFPLATQFGAGEGVTGIPAFKENIKSLGFDYLTYSEVVQEGGVESWDAKGGVTIGARRYPTAVINGTKVAFTTEGLYLYKGKVEASYESDTDDNGNAIYTIQRIVTDPEKRGMGSASKALSVVTDAADKAGLTLQLEPEAITTLSKKGDKVMSKKQLIEWYKRNGFDQKFDGSDNILTRKPKSIGVVPTQFGTAISERDKQVLVAVNINDSSQKFTSQILSGEKTIETRDTLNNALQSLRGQRVGIARTGVNDTKIVGYATVGQNPIHYKSEKEFRKDQDKHLVKAGSKFDIKPNGEKFGYELTDVVAVTPFEPASTNIKFSTIDPSKFEGVRPTLATQFGAASQLPAGFDADAIDYSNFLESLEMPMMEIGTYQSPSKLIDKLLKGELDPRILRLKNQRDFFNKATFDLVQRYKTKLDAIITKDFGGIENAPLDLIQDATGSTKGVTLSEETIAQIEDDFNYDLDTIDTDETLTIDEKVEARDAALVTRNKAIADAEKAAADMLRARRDDALGQLALQSPELVQHIVQLRTLTDELSKKVAGLYGFPPELKAKFDNQLGIYLTRTYRMFDEVGYGEKVLQDPAYEEIRNEAANFFEKQFIKQEVARRISGPNSVPRAQAEAEAKRELGLKSMGGRTYGQLMVEEFISGYDKSGQAITATGLSQSLKPLLDNIQMKRDIPKPIRDLLGEKGSEVGVDNLLRSLVTTATMAANQSFLNHVREIGRSSGWLLTASELTENRKKDYDTYKDYKPIRSSTTSSYDPIGELYGPPEMVEGFRKVFSPDGMRFNQTTAQEVVAKTMGVVSRLSGAAMAAKTLGSIGFYVRNIVSNALFFAPAQGFVNFKSMATKAYDEVWSNAVRDPNKIDAYRTKLISLGVIGDDINTSIMTAMLNGGQSVDDVETKLNQLIDTANKGMKPLKWLSERAQVLSGSVDAFYKIAYYENELRVLKEARSVDTGTLASMSDSQLERMAAEKVLATAQSSSQAPPVVREVTKSGIGLLFAPFLRFKVEVPRIVLNTYKTSLSEMRSNNPVLVQRGITRFAGMSFMLTGVSAIVPAVASMVAGIGDDEDEALRSSLPEYLRNHTFFYRRRDNGQLQSWDFTFLNPFSIVADPVMRSMEQLMRGNPAKAAAKFIETSILDQYLDDQILSSAVQNLRDNENPTTKKPIYEEKLDNAGIVLLKSLSFLFKEAYQPSVMKRAIESYQAVGADYTEFDDSPIGILMREFYPVKRHDVELDKQLRRYLSETRDVYGRINERKNALFSKKAIDTDSVKELIQTEIEDKAKINEDVYKKLRGFESLGLTPQQLYQITTGMGYGKDRTRLLFNKLMDRPVLSPEFIKRLTDPENEQGAERLKAAAEVLQSTPRYILLEP